MIFFLLTHFSSTYYRITADWALNRKTHNSKKRKTILLMNNNTELLLELTKYSRPIDTNSYVIYVNEDGTKEIITINQAKERDTEL